MLTELDAAHEWHIAIDDWWQKPRWARLAMAAHMVVTAQMRAWDSLTDDEKRQKLSNRPLDAMMIGRTTHG